MMLVPPTREEVAARWRSVACEEALREEVSAWAEPLMLAQYKTTPDVMVMQALQYLHGFDLTYRSPDHRRIGHGGPGPYIRTSEQVWQEFGAWLDRCEAFDADPETWSANRRREAEVALQRESEQH
jgi:hypothetical protein